MPTVDSEVEGLLFLHAGIYSLIGPSPHRLFQLSLAFTCYNIKRLESEGGRRNLASLHHGQIQIKIGTRSLLIWSALHTTNHQRKTEMGNIIQTHVS